MLVFYGLAVKTGSTAWQIFFFLKKEVSFIFIL